MLNWMILPLKRYADFNGRSRRMEFWSFAVLNLIVYAVIFALAFATGVTTSRFESIQGGYSTSYTAGYALASSGVGTLALLWWLATLLPSLAVTVRRFHDRDLSGWWYLLAFVLSLIPLLGVLVGIALLVFLLLPGTPGPNRFGPDPKDPTGAGVFA